MPTLGEFIGALLADAASARIRADLEAVKIAEVYAGHELLKHLPVPRFRLPDITLEFPVVVSDVTIGTRQTSDGLFTQPSEDEVTKALERALAEPELRISEAERAELRSLVSDHLGRAFTEEGPRIVLTPDRVSRRAAAAASAAFGRMRTAGADASNVERAVRGALRGLLLTKLTETPHVEVRVASGEVKSHNNPESVLRVRMTISEDSYEMAEHAESGGYKLIPE